MKKIFIACSKWCYHYIPEIKQALELMDFEVILPNYYDNPMIEEDLKTNSDVMTHQEFCKKAFETSRKKSEESDAILVLNMDKIKDGNIYPNYIGGATFLEMYNTYLLNKDIFLFNPIPEGMLKDEIIGMGSIVINGDLTSIKSHYKVLKK